MRRHTARFHRVFAALLMPLAFALQAAAQDKPKVEVMPQILHSGQVTSVAFSPDGRHFLSGSEDRTLKLWDASSGLLLRTFQGHSDEVVSVTFSANGLQVLSGSADNTLRLWDAATGKLLRTFEAHSHTYDFVPIPFSPDGRQVLSGSSDNMLRLWDAATGTLIHTFEGHSNEVTSVAVSPDGRQVLSGSTDKTLKLWSTVTGELLRTFEGHSDRVRSVAFSPDGRRVLSGADDKTLRLWDVLSGDCLKVLEGHSRWVGTVSFSPNGRILLSGGGDRTWKLWDADSGKLLRSIDAHFVNLSDYGKRVLDNRERARGSLIISAAFSPDGLQIIASDWFYGLELWNVADGRLLRPSQRQAWFVHSALFSRDGKQVLSAHADATIRLWDGSSGRLLLALRGQTGASSTSVSFSPDGRQLLAGGGKELRLWDAENGQSVRTFETSGGLVRSVAFSPNGQRMLAVYRNMTFSLWDVRTATLLRTITYSASTIGEGRAIFSPNGDVLSTGESALMLWSAESGELIRSYQYGRSELMSSIDYSPDGKKVLAGGSRLRMWDTENGTLVHMFEADAEKVIKKDYWQHAFEARGYTITTVAFSPDGRHFLAGDSDGAIKLWDATSGRLVRTLGRHEGPISAVAFAPDGWRVLSTGKDGAIGIWNVESGKLIANIAVTRENEWVAITPDGFFVGLAADQILSLVRGLDVTTVGQVHQSLFSPDLVRAALAGDPGGEVRDAAKVINLEKVLDSGPAPSITIASDVDGSQSSWDVVSLRVRITDRGKGIGRIEWRVNGVTSAVAAKPTGAGPDYTLTQQLALDAGDNIIEVVAYNASNLLASLPARITIKFTGTADAVKPKLHVLAIGINAYNDKGWTPAGQSETFYFEKLKLAVKDAKAFGDSIKRAAGSLYADMRLTTLTDKEATREGVRKAIDKIAGEVHPRDTFILFAAAHGKSEAGRFYLIPQDYDGGPNPEALTKRAIDQSMLQDWLANRISAKKALILLDTCESGALVSGYSRSRTDAPASEAALGRLHEATGRPVLTAAAEGSPAFEGYEGHGVFTWALLDALKNGDRNSNGTIELSELVAHVQDQVPKLAAKLNGIGRAAIAVRGSTDGGQSARFGSKGEDFVLAQRLQ